MVITANYTCILSVFDFETKSSKTIPSYHYLNAKNDQDLSSKVILLEGVKGIKTHFFTF